VRRSLLERDASDDDFVPVDDIRGYRIVLRNTGTKTLENLLVRFWFEPGSRVISIEPEMGDAKVATQPQDGDPRYATARLPFLNMGKVAIFSIQTVNSAGGGVGVASGAPGLSCHNMSKRDPWTVVLMIAVPTIALGLPAAILKVFVIADTLSVSDHAITGQYVAKGLIFALGGMLAASSQVP
jgi:hypothetical protein